MTKSDHTTMNKYDWTVDVLRNFWYCHNCKSPREKNTVFKGKFVCYTCFASLVNPVKVEQAETSLSSFEVESALKLGLKVRRKSWSESSSIRMNMDGEIHSEGDFTPSVYDPFALDWEIVQ